MQPCQAGYIAAGQPARRFNHADRSRIGIDVQSDLVALFFCFAGQLDHLVESLGEKEMMRLSLVCAAPFGGEPLRVFGLVYAEQHLALVGVRLCGDIQHFCTPNGQGPLAVFRLSFVPFTIGKGYRRRQKHACHGDKHDSPCDDLVHSSFLKIGSRASHVIMDRDAPLGDLQMTPDLWSIGMAARFIAYRPFYCQ